VLKEQKEQKETAAGLLGPLGSRSAAAEKANSSERVRPARQQDAGQVHEEGHASTTPADSAAGLMRTLFKLLGVWDI
jgi:hypothetical protein